jgi:hypothetical protein
VLSLDLPLTSSVSLALGDELSWIVEGFVETELSTEGFLLISIESFEGGGQTLGLLDGLSGVVS